VVALKKYNLSGDQIGEIELADEFCYAQVRGQMIKDYIVAIRRNARQWSACTQDRSQVNHSKKKPHRQKGSGRARQGSLAAPHFRGGGRPFGPRPKFDQHVRINRKERRLAIRALLAEKIQGGQVVVIEDVNLPSPSTKRIAQFLQRIELPGRTLVLAEAPNQNLSKSIRNLPHAQFSLFAGTNGYDLLRCRSVVLTEAIIRKLNRIITGG
jgi:large subunit ribosomal protein L4